MFAVILVISIKIDDRNHRKQRRNKKNQGENKQ